MTIVAVILIGTGVLFIASSLDNTPIVQTFQKIISGQFIDWSGTGQIGPAQVTQPITTGNCTLVAQPTLTQIEQYCACVNGTGTPGYQACLRQYA